MNVNVPMLLTALFDIAWLSAVLLFLVLIWRSSERTRESTSALVVALVDVAKQNADSVRMAVEDNRTLIALLQNQLPPPTSHEQAVRRE